MRKRLSEIQIISLLKEVDLEICPVLLDQNSALRKIYGLNLGA